MHVVLGRGMLQAMSWLGSASDLGQLIAAVASPVVAVVAIRANLRTTRFMLADKHEERLWDRRTDLYVDLIRIVESEGHQDADELWMTADTLDNMPDVNWQPSRDLDPKGRAEYQIQVSAYASDRVLQLYAEWDHALLRLAGVVQPQRVTGAARPADLPAALRDAADSVNQSGSRLRDQIRSELQPVPEPARRLRKSSAARQPI
jgi:hypothetical protein